MFWRHASKRACLEKDHQIPVGRQLQTIYFTRTNRMFQLFSLPLPGAVEPSTFTLW